MPKAEDPRDKVREQIEEILEKEESRKTRPRKPRGSSGRIRIARPTTPRKVRSAGPAWWYPTPEKLIVAGMAIMLIGAATRRWVLPLVLVGFLVSGTGYYMLIVRKRKARNGDSSERGPAGSPAQYWRGKRIDPGQDAKKAEKDEKSDRGKILDFPDQKKDKDLRDR